MNFNVIKLWISFKKWKKCLKNIRNFMKHKEFRFNAANTTKSDNYSGLF